LSDAGRIEYRLTSGEHGRVEIEAVSHVSVLSDGRGVIYLAEGDILVVVDGKDFFRHWSTRRTG
jgi:hypothetical protein